MITARRTKRADSFTPLPPRAGLGEGRGVCSATLLFALTLGSTITGAQPATAPASELPPAVQAALTATQDLAFNFDQPGFYAVVEALRAEPAPPGHAEVPLVVSDWRDLLERPSDFRGRVVTVEGQLGRNKPPFQVVSRPQLGWLSQLELFREDQPLACTVICTEPVGDLPVGATLSVTGYFVMIRQYHGPRAEPRQAALLVTTVPTVVVPPPDTRTGVLDWRWLLASAVLGLLVAIVILRRYTYVPRHSAVATADSSTEAVVADLDRLARPGAAENVPPPDRTDPPAP